MTENENPAEELGKKLLELSSALDAMRLQSRLEYDALAAEYRKVKRELASLKEQHRGYDDLEKAILDNLRDTSMRNRVVLVTQLHKAQLEMRRMMREHEETLVDVERCREIAERDGRDYTELHRRYGLAAVALEKATAELEGILAAQERCGDPDAECPLQDSHKPGSTKDIAAECRALMNGEPKPEATL